MRTSDTISYLKPVILQCPLDNTIRQKDQDKNEHLSNILLPALKMKAVCSSEILVGAHSVIAQKTNIGIFTAVRTSNQKNCVTEDTLLDQFILLLTVTFFPLAIHLWALFLNVHLFMLITGYSLTCLAAHVLLGYFSCKILRRYKGFGYISQ
jgi:hypothetical protein